MWGSYKADFTTTPQFFLYPNIVLWHASGVTPLLQNRDAASQLAPGALIFIMSAVRLLVHLRIACHKQRNL